jgi:trehalose 6-phosphate phosphatase
MVPYLVMGLSEFHELKRRAVLIDRERKSETEWVSLNVDVLAAAPGKTGLFWDVDGTLAPIVERHDQAGVPEETKRLLIRLSGAYAENACVSGRGSKDVRERVGIPELTYVGNHGLEILLPGEAEPIMDERLKDWPKRVHAFSREVYTAQLEPLGIRFEGKGPIIGLHWRGVADEERARAVLLEGIKPLAEERGLGTHVGRKVLEIRPGFHFSKATGIKMLIKRNPAIRIASFAGDDVTDIDAMNGLHHEWAEGELLDVVSIGVIDPSEPRLPLESRANILVVGTEGLRQHVLQPLAERVAR